MKSIPFHIPFFSGGEEEAVRKAVRISESGKKARSYRIRCEQRLQTYCGSERVLLTSSCTHALEMAALLCDIGPGDEVILPSFTFVSTANAFALRGARLCFVDIDPKTMNIDPALIEPAITPNTKAIVVVHYGGVSCQMAVLQQLAERYNLYLIEDAAHGIFAFYNKSHLGTMGHLGALSFHETKNIHCNEGGALLVNDPVLAERAAIIREMGTNREAFFSGNVDHYEWVDIGSKYHLNELSAAFLWPQLKQLKRVTKKITTHWKAYYEALLPLQDEKKIELCEVPSYAHPNAHLFFLKCKDHQERTNLIAFLKAKGIAAYFHYVPLHRTPAGKRYGYFAGTDRFTTFDSERLLRLPLFFKLKKSHRIRVVKALYEFYDSECPII